MLMKLFEKEVFDGSINSVVVKVNLLFKQQMDAMMQNKEVVVVYGSVLP